MGQEILYCYKCQTKIVGADFSGGKAFQVGNHVSCASCAADLLQTLDHHDREQLLSKMFKATQDRQQHSTGTLPAIKEAAPPVPRNLKISTVRLAAVPETPAPKGSSPMVPIAVGAVILIVAILAIAMTMGGSETPKRETSAVVAPRPPVPPLPAKPELTPAEAAARDAVSAARAFAAKNPKDLEGQISRWREAAGLASGTAFAAETRREMDAVLGRRKDAISKELAELEEKVKAQLAAKKQQAAIDLLQSARARYSDPEWSQPLDRRLTELYQEAARNSAPPEPPVQATIKPPEVPKPPPPPLSPAEAKWEAALGRASSRDYAGALEGLKDSPADLEVVRLAASVLQEGQDLIVKWPKGQALALDAPDRVEGVLLRADASRLALKQTGGTVWIEIGDITPGSLAEIFRTRSAKKPDDERAAALFCLLEGDVDTAQKVLGGKRDRVPEKYWTYGAKVAELRRSPEVVARESEAREIWRASADGIVDYTRTAPSVEQCRMLLRDFAGTGFVARNRAAIANRAGGGKEYLFCADNLKATGAWKAGKSAKADSCWTCEKDGPGNSIELSYTAFAGSEYRCWVYVGACCQETFAFSAEGSDMPIKPVKNTIVGLKKAHSMHGGPKVPTQWAWIPVPLPKDSGAGVKVVRLVSEQQGFSVAYAAVTLQKDPPKDSDLRDFERIWKDLSGGARKTPAPVVRPGKVIVSHDFSKGAGGFSGHKGSPTEIVDADPGVKAVAISTKGVSLDGFQLTIKPTTTVRFRVKATMDLDYFECMTWVQAKGNNAWHHIRDLKKGEWRTIEFKMADMHLGWDGPPIPGETVGNLLFHFTNRPDDARVLLTDLEIRE
ncbi:MAG TPA: hypothetical protein VNM14_20545 [Planctomycetota bacterium]|nr:hypothetical protein [Planctomycetota bacterium]